MMKTIYFISNNLLKTRNVVFPKSMTFQEAREKTMLNVKGEQLAEKITHLKNLSSLDIVYSSLYVNAMDTSKYIANQNQLDIILDSRLNERIVGELGSNEYRFLKGMQEHDFSYKLPNGESIQDVQKRMILFLEDLLKSDFENIAIVSHNIALLSLFVKWCNCDYNLEDHLILEYQDDVIFDGTFHEIDIIQVVFENQKLVSIKRIL